MPTLTLARSSNGAAFALSAENDLAAHALAIARRTALGVLGDRDAASDVAQEVALLVVRRHGTLRNPAALDGWVHRIAVNASLREAGRMRRRRAAEEARLALQPSRHTDEIDDTLALLDGLPPRQRAALTLRYVHDLTDAEIARALRCRPGTVRSLLSRGREVVRARLHDASEYEASE